MNDKDIRFIAVDHGDAKVKDFMSDQNNAYTELDSRMFSNSADGIFTGNETFDNVVMFKGRLQEDPEKLVNHSNNDTNFVQVKIVVRDGYFDLKGNHHNHTEVIPLRFFKHLDQIMLAKQGDAIQVTGSLKTYITSDSDDPRRAAGFFYVSVKSFGIMFGSAIRKQVKAKFEPKKESNDAAANDLVTLLQKASPAEKAKILSLLRQQPADQSSNANTKSSDTKFNGSVDITDDDLKSAFNQDF